MKERVHVCHIATLTRWGGVERLLVDFLTHVGQDRVRHKLITTSSIPEIVQPIKDAGIEVFEPQRQFHYDMRAAYQMADWLNSHEVSVVHSYNAFANAWGSLATRLAHTPFYLTYERGTIWSVRPPLAWLDRWANRRAQLVIANSRASAKLLELKYKVSPGKIRVVHNAIPPISPANVQRVRAQLGISEDALVIGSVGRLDTAKDYATFIETSAIVSKRCPRAVFVLVGGGPLKDELHAYVRNLGMQDYFVMTDWRDDARTLIQGFDIFVSTSIREPFGNVLIEAALCGKPVVAPAIDGIPEAVLHEQTGILLRPTKPVRQYSSPGATSRPNHALIDNKFQSAQSLDPMMLADTLLKLLSDPALRFHYGKNAKERAQRLFSIERYVSELHHIYLNIEEI